MSCRWCGFSGHNRTTCSKRMKYIQDNPGSWEARTYRENISSVNNKRSAKCSWCGSKEHNKRTCNIIIDDIIALTNKNANYRKHYLEFCKNKGIGIGALVKMDDVWGYTAHPEQDYRAHNSALGLIVDIDWNDVTYPLEGDASIIIEFMSVYDYGGTKKMIGNHKINPAVIAKEYGKLGNTTYGSNMLFDVVSPGHVMIENEAEWLKGAIPKSEFDRSIRGQRNRDHYWAEGLIKHYTTF